jgi:hypothetical protein
VFFVESSSTAAPDAGSPWRCRHDLPLEGDANGKGDLICGDAP